MTKQIDKPSLEQVDKHLDRLACLQYEISKLLATNTSSSDLLIGSNDDLINRLDEIKIDLEEYIENLNNESVDYFKGDKQ